MNCLHILSVDIQGVRTPTVTYRFHFIHHTFLSPSSSPSQGLHNLPHARAWLIRILAKEPCSFYRQFSPRRIEVFVPHSRGGVPPYLWSVPGPQCYTVRAETQPSKLTASIVFLCEHFPVSKRFSQGSDTQKFPRC